MEGLRWESPKTVDEGFRNFIQLYKSLPELWNTLSPLYSNRCKKIEGYKKLLRVLREVKPGATECDVKKQINSLRSNYRRELNKVKASKRLGSNPDDVYKPSSWKFYALSFLQDGETPEVIVKQENEQSPALEEVEEYESDASSIVPETYHFSSITPIGPPPKKVKTGGAKIQQNELRRSTCNCVSNEPDDEIFDIAKVWANKLRNLKPIQRKLAEKAINDIFFEADMENLHRYSVQINCENTMQSGMSLPSSSNYTG